MPKKNAPNRLEIIAIQALVIVVAFLFFGELIGRGYEKQLARVRPRQLQKESLEFSPSVFATHVFPTKVQNFVNRYWRSSKYGNPDYYINAKGYRGPDFNVEKKPGTIRIIVYGGSSVFDLALPEGKDWPHQVEQYLHADGFANAEVINAGSPGYASYDSLGIFFAEGHHFKPDYVILYHTWNDIKRFATDTSLLRELQPYNPGNDPFLYHQNILDQYLDEHSYLYTLLRLKYLKWKYRPGLEGAAKDTKKEYKLNRDAMDQFKLSLEMFVDCARNIGATPILMTEGTLIQKDNQKKEKWRLRHVAGIIPYDFSYTAIQEAAAIIRFVVKEKNADLIDAKRLLVEKDRLLYIDHIHLDDTGSDELAIIVKNKLEELIKSSANQVKK